MRNLDLNILVSLFLRGDKEAFAELFRRYYPRLLSYSRKFIDDESICQDVVQETFIKLWEKRSSIKDTNLKSYMFTIVRNNCLNRLKQNKVVETYSLNALKETKGESLYIIDFWDSSDKTLLYHELENILNAVIDSLSERCRQVFLMSRQNKMTNSEIANKLGISVKTVEKHITRALKAFDAQISRCLLLYVLLQIVAHI